MELKPGAKLGLNEIDDPTLTLPAGRPASERAGKYRIVGRIGQGGMGVVYRAIDEDLGRTVALKFIPPERAANPTTEQRFLREARAASALDHLNIGTIFGVEETGDHRRFIVMAYYEGRNLSQRMQDEANPLTPDEAVAIAMQVASGLSEAHARGVVHRDIKPSNILLTAQGVVKIVDFGLAAMSGSGHLTQAGTTMGTPAYMSPEQALGAEVDQRSDIWSLGVVLCEMVTRQKVFQAGSMMGVMYQVVHGDVPALDTLQSPLRAVLSKALVKDPAKRYQSMSEFRAALESLQPASLAPRPATGRWKISDLRAPRPLLALPLAVLLVLGAATAVFIIRTGPAAGGKKPAVAGAPAAANVLDKYQKALELTRRWDKEGNLDQAIALLTDATKQDTGFALGFARLADAQRIQSSLTHDKALLESALRNAEQAVRLNGDLSPVHVALGRIQMARGSNDLALASFESAIRIDVNDAESHQAIAGLYGRLGRLKDADASYRRAVSLDPDNISIHDSYGNFLFRQSRYADAVREWQDVIRIAPDNAPAYINLGSALMESGKIAEPIAMFRHAVELRPNYMAYTNLGTAYSRAQRYSEAAEAYRKALGLDNKDSLVWGNLADVYSYMNGMDAQTMKTFAQAIELAEAKRKDRPRDAFVDSDLAQYYAKTGKPQLALTRLDTALALSPKEPEIQAAAGEVYELLGQRAKALAFLRQSLELGYPRQRLERNPEFAKLLKSMP